MNFDFTPFFKRYEALAATADQIFNKVRSEFPDAVRCETRCADCCHALFDLTLIEALYLNHRFNEKFQGPERAQMIEKANRSDRRIHKIKRKAYKAVKAGSDESQVLEDLAGCKERCPLLNADDMCDLYAYRPITCRLYGIPTAIGGKGHTCGKSGFVAGRQYPTVNMDNLQRMLYELSAELVSALNSRHKKMGDILVPVSMAMLTDYDETYLGVPDDDAAGPGTWIAKDKGASDE